MSHVRRDLGRRDPTVFASKVKEVLPEYFGVEHPKLIEFLEQYYHFLDSDHAFGDEIHELFKAKDATELHDEHLNYMIQQLAPGLKTGDLFLDPRFSVRRFGDYYRTKGSKWSIEEFFRALFQQEVEVEYPKKDIFTVGRDAIGYDSQKYIQNYARYQIFSILIKVGLGVPTYRELYKQFVHPAGFYFEGIVALEGEADLGVDTMPISIPDSAFTSIISEASIEQGLFTSLTGLADSTMGGQIRYNINQLVDLYDSVAASTIGSYYSSIAKFITPNSFTMDDSADSIGPRMSLTFETLDNNMFTRYTSDSSY